MNFATWSIRSPIPAIVLFLLMTLAGLSGFSKIGIQDMPDIDFPEITVTATLSGTAPSQMETEVTRKIENAISTLSGVRHISSTITEGQSQTDIEFVLEKDVTEALNDVRDAITRIRSDLPSNIDEPQVSKQTTTGEAVLVYSVASPHMSEEELSWFVTDTVKKLLLAVPGVGGVERIGGTEREIRVEVDPTKLMALGITAAEVSEQIRRIQRETSGGTSEIGGSRQALRTLATVSSAPALAAMDIALQDGRHLRLDQVATISDTVVEPTQLTLFDGKPVVAFSVTRARGHSVVTMADGVTKALADLQSRTPGLKVDTAFDLVKYSRDEYAASMEMLYEGALLAVLVVWFFLRDWRATLVSASALPLSVIPTFAVIYWMGYSLNTVSLLALTLVVGLLVDDAIVEIENIVRHLRMGKSPLRAAMDAATEIGLAVIATTMTLVAVFLPTAFMSGILGLFFKQFGWTSVIAILASLAVARLLTPMMAAYFLKAHPPREHTGKVMSWYLRLVSKALRHRHLTIVTTLVIFAASLALIPLMPKDFLPSGDIGTINVSIESPPGTSLKSSTRIAETARTLISDTPEIDHVISIIGGSDLRKASLYVNLVPKDKRDRSQQEVETLIRDRLAALPGVRLTVGSGDGGEMLKLTLSGDNPTILTATAQQLEREMRTVPGLGNVVSSASLLRPEVIVRPDFARAAELGVTAEAIGETLRVATAGNYDSLLPKLNLSDRQIDIRVQLPLSFRDDLSSLEQLRVPGRQGTSVPLSSVASLSVESGPVQITRFDRSRDVSIKAELGGRPLGDASDEVNKLPTLQHLPPGVHKQASGHGEHMEEMFGSFVGTMLTGVLCVYFVLVLLFKDFMQPITILAALPLSLGGAFAALLVTGNGISMPSLIGLLMLMGVVTKNSILLVDYVLIAMHEHGKSQFEALIDACRKRAQPILMTTVAMAAGMAPVALGLSGDSAFRGPMAIAVIGGVITSTALSLVVVPVVFTYIADLERRLGRLFGHKTRALSEETSSRQAAE